MQNVLFKIGINNDNSWPKIAVKRESLRSRIPYSRIKSRNLTFCALCEIKSIEKRPLSFSLSTSKIGKGGESWKVDLFREISFMITRYAPFLGEPSPSGKIERNRAMSIESRNT